MASASLEIHVINVSQGDSVLIVNRDHATLKSVVEAYVKKNANLTMPTEELDLLPMAIKYKIPLTSTVLNAMLIDGGNAQFGGDIVEYLEAHGVLDANESWTPKLTLVVSHFHVDHMTGLRTVLRKPDPMNPKKTVERYRPGEIWMPTAGGGRKATAHKNFMTDVKSATAFANSAEKTTRVDLGPGGVQVGGSTGAAHSKELRAGGPGKPAIRVQVVAASLGVDFGESGYELVPRLAKKRDENDHSVVLVVEYGSFRCLLGGDIAGNGLEAGGNEGTNQMNLSAKKFFSSSHADVETTLARALRIRYPKTTDRKVGDPKFPSPGYCTVFKLNHHGSSSSNDVNFLATVQPLVVAISSGFKQRFHRHPTPENISRLLKTKKWPMNGITGQTVDNSIEAVVVTEMVSRGHGKKFDFDIGDAKIVGDIVIRPTDESIGKIQATGTSAPVDLAVQVYGSGLQTAVTNAKRSTLRECEPKTQDPYPSYVNIVTDSH